jgi:hypothetical protein
MSLKGASTGFDQKFRHDKGEEHPRSAYRYEGCAPTVGLGDRTTQDKAQYHADACT